MKQIATKKFYNESIKKYWTPKQMYYNCNTEVLSMSILSVRVSKEDELLLKNYAKLNNISISQLLRDSAIEKIEDELDLKTYENAYEEYLKNPITFSLEEVIKELADEENV